MPPKPKYTKEEIITAGYEVMRENGIDAVVARIVGKRLGTTATPIFTYFDTMEELKEEVYRKAQRECADYLNECIDFFPAFKEFGLRWIRFAKENPHIYSMLFMLHGPQKTTVGFINTDFIEVMKPMQKEIMDIFSISEQDAEQLIEDMVIYAQGIASMCVNGVGYFPEEQISRSLSRLCISCVTRCRVLAGNLDVKQMQIWMSNLEKIPERKARE